MLIPVPRAAVDAVLERRTPEPRLVQAAHTFEAQLMKELLKPLIAPSDEQDAEGSAGVLGAFAGESLGAGLSARGGFGIADSLIGQLSRNASAAGPDTGTKRDTK